MTPEERIVALEARITILEKAVAYLTKRDHAARKAELALAERGVV